MTGAAVSRRKRPGIKLETHDHLKSDFTVEQANKLSGTNKLMRYGVLMHCTYVILFTQGTLLVLFSFCTSAWALLKRAWEQEMHYQCFSVTSIHMTCTKLERQSQQHHRGNNWLLQNIRKPRADAVASTSFTLYSISSPLIFFSFIAKTSNIYYRNTFMSIGMQPDQPHSPKEERIAFTFGLLLGSHDLD